MIEPIKKVTDFHDELQFVYRLYEKLVNQYAIPGDWTPPQQFVNDLVDQLNTKKPLTQSQSRFFNFLLDNKQTIHDLKTGMSVTEIKLDDDNDNIQVRLVEDNNEITITPVLYNHETESSGNIIHVVNMINPDTISDHNLKSRVKLAIKSIEQYSQSYVTRVACQYEKSPSRTGWSSNRLTRSAKSTGLGDRHLAYLHDLFDTALKYSTSDDDYLLYSNLDCVITPTMYSEIISSDSPVVEFHRRDVKLKSNLNTIFQQPYDIKHTGIDAIAIQASVYKEYIKHILPDMLIGEPHWDTVLSHLVNKEKIAIKSTTGLYHPIHEQAWNSRDLSPGGKHNKQHMYNSIEYGLIPDEPIKLDMDTMCIVFDHRSTESTDISELYQQLNTHEIVTVRYTPSLVKVSHPYTNYYDVEITDSMRGVDQTNAIINKLILCNEHVNQFKIYIVTDEQIPVEPTHNILYNKFTPMNIYKNIKDDLYCYMNDSGMLERVNT